jgi:predicted transcriptional regulator
MSTAPAPDRVQLAKLTTRIVTAWLEKNRTGAAELGGIIRTVGSSFQAVRVRSRIVISRPAGTEKPAVPVKRSVTGNAIICLHCGGKYRSLKRHLQTVHGLTAQDYIARWNLPKTYPFSTVNYSHRRSNRRRGAIVGA